MNKKEKRAMYCVAAIYWGIFIALMSFANHHYVRYCNLSWEQLACMNGFYIMLVSFAWHWIVKVMRPKE